MALAIDCVFACALEQDSKLGESKSNYSFYIFCKTFYFSKLPIFEMQFINLPLASFVLFTDEIKNKGDSYDWSKSFYDQACSVYAGYVRVF